ncbi:MAG: hydrogenase expression/formation protein HypE [Firmicutes bacterium]|nr:hydrogenase expression/formation protein HypE [Bacillota bacterium]
MSDERVLLAHGAGGKMSQQLIERVFKKKWTNHALEPLLDAAVLSLPGKHIAVTTDSFVITPIFFPGGDIGKLAVAGTVNDLIAIGAVPLYLAAAFIIEEGFKIADLEALADSMAQTASQAGVKLVTGDTKVVERGSADGIFITTTGVGFMPLGIEYQPQRIEPGDKVILTGNAGDHGLAILAQREGLSFTTPVVSDCRPLIRLGEVTRAYGPAIKCLRDPTRGGVATVLNELAQQSGTCFHIRERDIPIAPAVRGACEMLGMDPLYLANEGKMVIIVSSDAASQVLTALRQIPEAADAALIGEVKAEPRGMVVLKTEIGAERILGMLEGEHLPRIC